MGEVGQMGDVFRLLQLADSAFPTGGYAHSSGLECAVQLGEVPDVRVYVGEALRQAVHASLPFVRDAHGAARAGGATRAEGRARAEGQARAEGESGAGAERGSLRGVDERCEAFLLSHVARRASRAQGRAMLATATRAFGGGEIARWDSEVRSGALRGHLAPMTGAVCAALGVSLEDTLALSLHGAARGLLSAAVRLGRLGPLEAQRIQAGLPLSELVREVPEEPEQTAPLHEVLGALHDRLYTRLFQS